MIHNNMVTKYKKYTAWYNEERKLHRLDGPAIEYTNGDQEWFQHGQYHRLDGPAIEWADGSKFWYQNDKKHRLDGPAVELSCGIKEYWIYGKKYIPLFLQFEKIIKKIKKHGK